MRFLVVLTSLLASCLAQAPHPCRSPPFLSGELTVSTQNEQLWAFAKYEYDGLGERLRFHEMGTYNNKSFTYDALLNYRQKVMYQINMKEKTCKKLPLKVDFTPMGIPKGANLLGQAVLGASSGPGEGLLVNTWIGQVEGIDYLATVTEFGCIPVSVSSKTPQFGWMLFAYFNNVVGITDPGQLNPPPFCSGAEIAADAEATDVFSLFHHKV